MILFILFIPLSHDHGGGIHQRLFGGGIVQMTPSIRRHDVVPLALSAFLTLLQYFPADIRVGSVLLRKMKR